jgi:hypothetical protein
MQVVNKCFYMYEIVCCCQILKINCWNSCKNSTINSKKSLQFARFLYFSEKYKDVQKIYFHNFYEPNLAKLAYGW